MEEEEEEKGERSNQRSSDERNEGVSLSLSCSFSFGVGECVFAFWGVVLSYIKERAFYILAVGVGRSDLRQRNVFIFSISRRRCRFAAVEQKQGIGCVRRVLPASSIPLSQFPTCGPTLLRTAGVATRESRDSPWDATSSFPLESRVY